MVEALDGRTKEARAAKAAAMAMDGSVIPPPLGDPTTAREYRAHVVKWLLSVETMDQLATRWAADRSLRAACEVGQDDIAWLGTLVEPKMLLMKKSEGLNDLQMAGIWIRRGTLELPWRA